MACVFEFCGEWNVKKKSFHSGVAQEKKRGR
jgi:hypothetical protein